MVDNLLVLAEDAGLPQHCVDQRRLAVVDVGDDCDVTDALSDGVALDGGGVNVFTENYLKKLPLMVSADSGDEQTLPSFSMNGILGNLKNFVGLKTGYEKLSQLLFGDVVLVDSLKNAMDAWIGLKLPVVTLDGETIVSADPTIGFLHTGIEKTAEQKKWQQVIPLVERMDYLGPQSNSLSFCLSVERLLGIEAANSEP